MHFTMSPMSPNTYCFTVLSLNNTNSHKLFSKSDCTKSAYACSFSAEKSEVSKSIDLIMKLLRVYTLSLSAFDLST